METISGGVTAAMGFQAAGVYAGIKKQKQKKDMALVYSTVPAVAAGTFTTNVVKAAPVKWDMKLMKSGKKLQAMVINSGIANACTGTKGDLDNETMAKAMAKELGIEVDSVLTASTGVIGREMPMDAIVAGTALLKEALSDGIEAGHMAAESIMTTDTISKECAVTIELGGKTVTIGAMSKGSGMIHPNMATMIGILTTDAAISKELLQEVISESVQKSFNMISVDRDTSTNDTYVALANGLAGNEEITTKNADYAKFFDAVKYVSTTLAKKMAGDGEGASKLIEARVLNAASYEDAVLLSKSIITSNLVKAAVFGNDANCGRFMCAMGYSGVQFNPDIVDLFFESSEGKIMVVENGIGLVFNEELATKILSSKEVTVIANMKAGQSTATAWGCDLTYDYVKINADYRS
ncbi:MAG: bifunctional ornithine acetyltransferase/N-acetylglutamate synthase [Clostridiales bacterium]|nr:bifunctional ornithine acetyltransferase/N-acetylglutamate synthase [Clostridiales bacterium]